MPYINLIEADLMVARNEGRKRRMSQFGLIGVSTVLGICYMVLLAQGSGLRAEEADTQARLKKLKPMLKEIDEDKRVLSDLQPRLTALKDAQELTSRWGRLMTHLTVNTPTDTYLTSVRADAQSPDKPIKVTFMGVGKTQTDASKFLLRCQNARDLANVRLVQSRERTFVQGTATEFEIAGNIVGTEPPVAPEEKGASKS